LTTHRNGVQTLAKDARRRTASKGRPELKKRIVYVCAAVLVASIGCIAQPAHADGVRSAIEAADAVFSAAAAKGDGAGLAALYAAEGQVMPAGSEPIRGTAAIQKFWQGALDSGIAGVGLKTLEVFAQGATATEVGQYELRDKAGKVLDHGKYVVVWRHEGGKWKLLRDMFSTNVPPAK
jgi:ketosteroid isomerase-like protein